MVLRLLSDLAQVSLHPFAIRPTALQAFERILPNSIDAPHPWASD